MTKAFDRVLKEFASGEMTVEELRLIKEAVDERILFESPDHVTEDPRVIRVGGKDINLIATGRAQRVQVESLNHWLKTYLLSHTDGEFDIEAASVDEAIDVMAALLNPEALTRLGMIITREGREFVEGNFDLAWLVGGTLALLHHHRRRMQQLRRRSILTWHNQQK